MQGFLNIYRSGWFHRANKPNGFDRHSGDIYLTKEAAIAEIDPISHYIDTIPVEWEDYEVVEVNPADAVPVPLSVSRKQNLKAA
jgi:hypothetical protein